MLVGTKTTATQFIPQKLYDIRVFKINEINMQIMTVKYASKVRTYRLNRLLKAKV